MKRARGWSARIEKYVDKSGDCWLWTGAANAKGYGISNDGLVHRQLYKMHYGGIPEGKYVLHKCDVRNCCNPEHLYAGTQKDNMRDAYERGRRNDRGQPKGDAHSLAKLTGDQVLELRLRASLGANTKDLSSAYGISRSQVVRIVNRQRWGHLPVHPSVTVVSWEENQK